MEKTPVATEHSVDVLYMPCGVITVVFATKKHKNKACTVQQQWYYINKEAMFLFNQATTRECWCQLTSYKTEAHWYQRYLAEESTKENTSILLQLPGDVQQSTWINQWYSLKERVASTTGNEIAQETTRMCRGILAHRKQSKLYSSDQRQQATASGGSWNPQLEN